MFRLGKIFLPLCLGAILSGYELNVTASSQSLYVGEPVRLTYTFSRNASEPGIDFRFAAPALPHFRIEVSDTDEQKRPASVVWKKSYTVVPMKSGVLPTGSAAMNIAERTYEKDAWGQWMPSVAWKQQRFGEAELFVKPLPAGIDAVGSFRITVTTDRNETDPGRPVHATVALRGCGDLEMADFPTFSVEGVNRLEISARHEAYWQADCYYSESVREYALVANQRFSIPSLVFRSFDPALGAVVKTQSLPIEIKVKSPTASAKTSTDTAEEEMIIASMAAAALSGFFIGVAVTLLFRRRKKQRAVRIDSLRSALTELCKHLDDPEAKKSAVDLEKHLYEDAAAPDEKRLSAVLGRLKT